MSWDSYRSTIVDQNPGIFASVSIWESEGTCEWTTPDAKFEIKAEDIKILKNDHKKFCEAGPRLMGLKFLFASDKLNDPENLCMTLKAMGAAEPYFLVFGFTNTAILVAKVIAQDAKLAVPPLFKIITHLKNTGI